jgi:hypothetical protein
MYTVPYHVHYNFSFKQLSPPDADLKKKFYPLSGGMGELPHAILLLPGVVSQTTPNPTPYFIIKTISILMYQHHHH